MTVSKSENQNSSDSQERIITPDTNWWKPDLSALWNFRELFFMMVKQQFLVRYKQMALGIAWVVLAPLCQLLVFTLLFSRLLNVPSDGYPYTLFAYAGLMPWDVFTKCTLGVSASLQENISVISKVYFPRIILPLVVVVRESLDALITLALLLIIAACHGYWPTWHVFLFPVVLFSAISFGLALGLICAGPIVRFRDLKIPLQYALQLGMFLTPVIYPPSILPPRYAFAIELNPMYWIIEVSRWTILGKSFSVTPMMPFALGAVLGILIIGWLVFAFTERAIIDVQ